MKKGFTLIELLISTVLSTIIVLMIYVGYRTLMDVQSKWWEFKRMDTSKRIVIDLQNQLLFCKDFKLERLSDSIRISYSTAGGYTLPFAKVELYFYKGKLLYKEYIPKGDILNYSKEVDINIQDVEYQASKLIIKTQEGEIPLLVREVHTPFHLY
ncbi:MAG: prepilin-type N-terminal cleavage/methylation domain-containing protein [Acidobacteria bacterium]|jgi:prepilin-type N-terminal cleavage/methylation domain-containing protein|nr:MAG: prepilin-type N-terminal cleavage/methylation domain-containing protein [Acidobacteriota bacterium]